MINQNPEQITRDNIDVMLSNAGWVVQKNLLRQNSRLDKQDNLMSLK